MDLRYYIIHFHTVRTCMSFCVLTISTNLAVETQGPTLFRTTSHTEMFHEPGVTTNLHWPWTNKIALNNFLLSKSKQDTSHRLYMWHGILTGNLILLLVQFGCGYISYFLCLSPFGLGICRKAMNCLCRWVEDLYPKSLIVYLHMKDRGRLHRIAPLCRRCSTSVSRENKHTNYAFLRAYHAYVHLPVTEKKKK